jgi:uncharacterized protein with HEPN domain
MWRDEHLLLDMLIHARRARDFNAGVAWDRFQSERMLQYATQFALQVVGEAASKVSRPFREKNPQIPWNKIIAFRHRIIHDYPNIELPKVWVVVQNYLPALIAALEPMVPPDEDDSA